jgi:hypothetical protein
VNIDMLISKNDLHLFWYDSSGTKPIPVDSIDFYYIVLHEFGHAVGLEHVNDPNAILWYKYDIPNAQRPANQRRDNIRVDESAIVGGNHEVDKSIDPIFNNGCVGSVMIEKPVCIGYTGIRNIRPDGSHILVYPNPFDNYLRVSIESGYPYRVQTAEIYSIDGRKLANWVLNPDSTDFTIELPGFLESGMYILNIVTDSKVITKKVVHVN